MVTLNSRPSVTEIVDAAGGITTTYVLNLENTVQGSISGSNDADFYKVSLVSGRTYTFSMIGTGSSYLLDPQLSLFNASGNRVAYNDDSGPGLASSLTFKASQTGTYFIGGSSWGDQGQYGISFSAGTKASFDLPMAAASCFTQSSTWGAIGSSATVTYGFRESGVVYDASGNLSSFSQFTSTEKDAVRTILQLWSDVCNIRFEETNPLGYTNNATILFANYFSATDGAGAYAYYPGSSTANSESGDVWLNLDSIDSSSIPLGSYSFFTIMHEIGHAIGLSHPGDYNAAPGVSITYTNSAQFQQDSGQFSVMSYFAGSDTGQSPGYFASAYTPMMADIYQMQILYGTNTTTRLTDTTYGFSNNTGASIYSFISNQVPLICIWDAGGKDTLDCSGYSQSQIINLNDASFSNIGGGVSNVSIAYGAVIENAKGGSGNDSILGSNTDNVLSGNNGADSIFGGDGNDTMDGGDGFDTCVLNLSRSDYIITPMEGSFTVQALNSAEGIDFISHIENFKFFDQSILASNLDFVAPSLASLNPLDGSNNFSARDNITLTFNESIKLNTGFIKIYQDSPDGFIFATYNVANPGNNLSIVGSNLIINPDNYFMRNTEYFIAIEDGAITDTQNNRYVGLSDYNFVTAPLVSLNLVGSTSGELLIGDDLDDTLHGLGGLDTMDGGNGSDIYLIGGATEHPAAEINDTGTSGLDELRFTATTANSTLNLYALDRGIEKAVIGVGTLASADTTGTTTINLNASLVTNALTMIGNNGRNTLTGTAYNDTIHGNGGNDSLIGNLGNDVIDGGTGIDTMVGGLGNDTYVVDSSTDIVTEGSNAGTDTIQSSVTYTASNNVEHLTLTGSSNINATGNSLNNILTGNSVNNTLNGGLGNDTMIGGDGNDTYVVDSTLDVVTEGSGAGIDTIQSSVTYTASTHVENLTLSGTSAINAIGNTLNNTLLGNSGNNSLSGLDGHDSLSGDRGNDTLNGGNGNDTLIGGLGNDSITGGLGNDTILFNTTLSSTANRDTISDFSHTDDTIQLSKAIFTALSSTTIGNTITLDQFYSAAGAARGNDSSDSIIYNTTNGALYYDADGSGATASIQIATLSNFATTGVIDHTDFVVVA